MDRPRKKNRTTELKLFEIPNNISQILFLLLMHKPLFWTLSHSYTHTQKYTSSNKNTNKKKKRIAMRTYLEGTESEMEWTG